MSKIAPEFSSRQLRILFHLMPAAEREAALNLRSHNPADVKMVSEVQAYVDQALGIKGNTFFEPGDDVRVAALKGIRNMLASRVKKRWVSRWFSGEIDGQGAACLSAYLDRLHASPKVRWLRAAALPRFLVLAALLLAKRLKRSADAVRGIVSQCADHAARRITLHGMHVEKETAAGLAGAQSPTVLLLTSLYHEIVNFTVRRVVEKLELKRVNVILAFHDGFAPTRLRSDGGEGWWTRINCVALQGNRSSLSYWAALMIAPRRLFPAMAGGAFALRRIAKATPGDWGSKWLVMRKAPALVAGFHVSLATAQKILSRFQPVSVLNCDNGSENLHVKAFAHACLSRGVPFYRYKPVPAFPVRQPVFNSVSRFMLATPDDAEIFRDNGSVPEFWHVGSPILDLAGPFASRNGNEPHHARAEKPPDWRILFFTKRDFPNRAVISAISENCKENRRHARLTVKLHPSDAKQFALDRSAPSGFVKIDYYGKEEIDQVDRLIYEADIVVSSSSNVIWSAFAQFKPVVYLAFEGMSSEGHVTGYRRYATSDFSVASEVGEVGEMVGALLETSAQGNPAKNQEHHDSLMRNFFCAGKFNSTERICRILEGKS